SGQVIDTCEYLSELNTEPVRLFAFISIRNYLAMRKTLKNQYKYSNVFPMFPKLKYWRLNIFILAIATLRYRCKTLICRNAIPTRLSLQLKRINFIRKVIYDARGLEYEQIREYQIIQDKSLAREIYESEKLAVLE